MTVVSVLCTLGCGVKIPVPVTVTARDGDADLTVKVGIDPVFDDQLDWHMRRFHGGRDDAPLSVAA